MAFGQGGVVELAQKLHAELLHDPLRAQVRDGREGYQFFDAQLCGERYAGLRRFRRITLIPELGPQAPTDFDFILHARKRYAVQSRITEQLAVLAPLDGVQAESLGRELLAYAFHEFRRLLRRQRCRKVLHHARVGVHGRKCSEVFFPPCAQHEPGCRCWKNHFANSVLNWWM